MSDGEENVIRIPLRDMKGEVVAEAVVDECDAHLAELRWYPSGHGYAHRSARTPDGKQYVQGLHREVMGCEYGDGLDVDHRNGDTLDCRRANLRVGTHAENQQNHSGWTTGRQTSDYRGVYWNTQKQKWGVRVTVNYRAHHVGFYDSEIVAAEAARRARLEMMPHTNEDRFAELGEHIDVPPSRKSKSTSKYRGVAWDKQKWRAEVMLRGVKHRLGRFDDEEEAAQVVAEFRAEHGF